MKNNVFVSLAFVFFVSCGDQSRNVALAPVTPMEPNSLYDVIEHAAIHMVDGPSKSVTADSVSPGPHIDPDSMEHRRLDVVLLLMDTLKGGYIHFGPDATGDFLVMTDIPARIRFINRKVVGSTPVDSLLEIEERFSARQITDSTSAAVTAITRAFLFEARTGGNILCIDSVGADTLKIVIEEAGHDHEE